jgi:PAS domain-containing protein
MSKPRKSGIEMLEDLSWGSHLCLFYETKQDMLDAVIPFFKAGLENNEFIIWVISNPHIVSAEEAAIALQQAVPGLRQQLENGQIEVLNEPDWYLQDKEFNIDRIIKAWNDKISVALDRGYDGMRASGDMFWLGQKYSKEFYAYEKYLHGLIAGLPAIILCTYPLSKFGGAEVLDIIQAHQFGIGRRQGKWELIESPELIRDGEAIKTVTEALQEGKRQRPRTLVMHYLAAVLSVVVTLILATTMAQTLKVTAPISLLLCAIIFSAWYGGLKPGLLALGLAIIALKFYLTGSIHSWNINARELPRFIVFTLSSFLVVLLIGAQKTAARSLQRALTVLNSTIRKLRETNGALRLQVIERRQAEDQLRLAYQRLSYHVENTPLAVIEFDKNLTITRWSGRRRDLRLEGVRGPWERCI